MKSWFLFTVAAIFPLTLTANPNMDSVSIGQATLSLPAPEGLFRVDSQATMSDQLRATLKTPSNRLLACYKTADQAQALEPGAAPIFHAQTPRGTEEIDYSIQRFQEMAASLSGLLGSTTDEDPKAGETKSLGVYDRGEHHINFAILAHQAGDTDEGSYTYTAAAMNNIAGKVVNLYCVVAAEPEANQTWAREQVAKWQQAVLTSNPTALSEPESSGMSPARRGAIIGGIAVIMGAFISTFLAKRKKQGQRIPA